MIILCKNAKLLWRQVYLETLRTLMSKDDTDMRYSHTRQPAQEAAADAATDAVKAYHEAIDEFAEIDC